jgi:hypothetical protein
VELVLVERVELDRSLRRPGRLAAGPGSAESSGDAIADLKESSGDADLEAPHA